MRRKLSTHFRIYILLSISTSIIFYSCDKNNIQYGQEYVSTNITNIVLVDSISPVVSTIFKDSVPTSQTGTTLLGNYNDPYFGKIISTSYAELAPPAAWNLLNNAQFDSLLIILKNDGSFYGDTTVPFSVTARQLTNEIILPEGQNIFFNTTVFPVSNTVLGSSTAIVRPGARDTFRIRLDDAKGQELFNMLKTNNPIVKDNAQFSNYFKGLRLEATSNAATYGFKDSVTMRLYYHQTDVFREDLHVDFSLFNKTLQFNNIWYDRSGTPLTILNTKKNEALSSETGNVGYLQPGTGLYLKISFPYIRKLLERPDFIKIIKADLVVQPAFNSYSNFYSLPPVLQAATTDGGNQPGATLSTVVGATSTIETGNLIVDNVYGTGTKYSYDVTTYLQQQIAIAANNKNGILLMPTIGSRYNRVARLAIGDTQNKNGQIQLKVYYISINK